MTPSLKSCAVCKIPATLKCSGCQNIVYCGKEHQKLDWTKGHKILCKCFRVATNDQLGRHLIATRDIKAGEIILKERPIFVAPKTISFPVCLGCHKMLQCNESGGSKFYGCSKCNWPLCNKTCESSESHRRECEIMQSKKFKFNLESDGRSRKESGYCVIAPLRVLILKNEKPNEYEKIIQLESHLEKRQNTPLYKILKTNVVTFIQTVLGMADVDENTILTIAGILDTNAFEIRLPTKNNIKIRGLYELASMMSHDCVANTRHIFDEKFQLTLIATTFIHKGCPITTTYTQSLQGTQQRRNHLKFSKCFECRCRRCTDPTELGTYLGSLKCMECSKGKLISSNPLSTAPDDDDGTGVDSPFWKCNLCEHKLTNQQIKLQNLVLQNEIEILEKKSPRALEDFLIKNEHLLHAQNSYALQIKYALIQLYGNIPGFLMSELNDGTLNRKILLCRELLDIADIIEPGLSQFRGFILLDLYHALSVQSIRNLKRKKNQKTQNAHEIILVMNEAVEILTLDPLMKDKVQQQIMTWSMG